jgi:Zn-dependent oligopeptidase
MTNLKHVGRFVSNGRKCLVAYRTLPGDAYNCLVIPTEALEDSYHDSLIQLVESNSAQTANEFAEVLARTTFPDGSIMLAALHTQGKLLRIATDQVEMIPNFQTKIKLDQLNVVIAEQMGVAVDDLSIKEDLKNKKRDDVEIVEVATVTETPMPVVEENFDDLPVEQRATKLRGQADKLAKQAAELRRQAEVLVPRKKR